MSLLILEIVIILVLIFVNGFFSASEIALVSLRKSRVRQLVKSGVPSARRVQKLQEEPERFLATVQIGVTLVGTLASAMGGVIAIERLKPLFQALPVPFLQRAAEPVAVGVVVGLITYATLVVGELAPKSIAIRYSEKVAFLTSAPIDALSRFFRMILRGRGIPTRTVTPTSRSTSTGRPPAAASPCLLRPAPRTFGVPTSPRRDDKAPEPITATPA